MKSRFSRIAAYSARMFLSPLYGRSSGSVNDRMDGSSTTTIAKSNHVVNNHVVNHLDSVSKDHDKKRDEANDPYKGGMYNLMAIWWLLLWYFFSALTLFLNKYIISTLQGDPVLLGEIRFLFLL